MHYDTFVDFKAALRDAAPIAPPEAPDPRRMADAQIDILYEHYSHARRQASLTVGRLSDTGGRRGDLGTAFDGGKGQLLLTPQASALFSKTAPAVPVVGRATAPRGITTGEWKEWQNGKERVVSSADWHKKSAKEQMDTLMGNKWSIWLNDAFVLGGIHAHARFHLVSEVSDYADARAQFPFNVTQRELIGLVTFGYSRGTPGRKGAEYTCTNAVLADAATFKAYVTHMNAWTAAATD